MSMNEVPTSPSQQIPQRDGASEPRMTISESSQTIIAKASKVTVSLIEKRQMYRVISDGVDVTPDDIVDPDYLLMDDTQTHAAFETRTGPKSEIGLKLAKSKSKSTVEAAMKVYTTTISLDDIYIDHTKNTGEGFTSDDIDLDLAPSAFYLPKQYPLMEYPKEVFIVLKETETQFLFELPCFSYEKGTAYASVVEEQNNYYQYITVGKGRNRKMVTEETQTKECVSQSRHTLATRPQKKNAIAFASLWDMHDTYAKLAKVVKKEEPDEMVMYQSVEPKLLRRKKKESVSTEVAQIKGKTFEEICNTQEFLDAVLLTERVLATLEFSDAQKKFRGLISFNPFSLDLVYVYSMKPLWTLECKETAGRPIASISFNPRNANILAVAHGKFTYAENFDGLVTIWCTKNPQVPERLYRFRYPLTAVAFSERNPNWLACGFDNGDVLVLDITSYSIKTVAVSKRETNPCFEPIWQINWSIMDGIQYVITTCQDGRINRFKSTKTHDFICSPMMRITTVEGKMKGLETAKNCINVDVPIVRNPAALCMKWHCRIEHIYIVGTDEGCIHKCSTHYLNQHIDVMRAHSGPVYSMSFSPFMKTLLMSCGADNAIRLWLEGIDDVIMTLNCPAAVYDAAFCPVNSTIIISVSGNVLSIWDIRRKNHIPCAEYKFPGNVVLKYIQFSKSGENVFVGDTLGRVHTFHLEDTPIPPFYQHKILDEAIKKALCTRPKLQKQLEKIEKYKERYAK
ncbi:dynein axonemal intermediate chain 4 [Battus philenor]|uniref:dynein axonemal intermediate chain 4 n=1 Tax=Battus philenor TaxID=42288 RepID=UPI0035CF9EB1